MRFRISSCKRVKARRPSPYRVDMLMSKIPNREYASSSTLVVLRFDTHDIRRATLKSRSGTVHRRTDVGMVVMSEMRLARLDFVPMTCQSWERKTMAPGATSS